MTAQAAYRHEFADRAATMGNAFAGAPEVRFVTEGYAQKRSRGEFGAGFGWEPSGAVSLGMDYQLRLASKQTSHAVMATVEIKF